MLTAVSVIQQCYSFIIEVKLRKRWRYLPLSHEPVASNRSRMKSRNAMCFVPIAMQSGIGERHMRLIVGKRYCHLWNKKEPVVGFEPTACSLRSSYSTTELHRLVIDCCISVALPLRCNAPVFIPKLLLNALTRPQEVHWTQSIITLTASRCQAFFNMRQAFVPHSRWLLWLQAFPGASKLVHQRCSTK